MNIKAAKNLPYNGIVLDAAAIQLKSIDPEKVYLPYAGPLPDKIKAKSAYIALQIRPNFPKHIIVCECVDKQRSYIIECTDDEIKALLDRFFYDADGSMRQDTGLEPFWLRLWTAHYEDWRSK